MNEQCSSKFFSEEGSEICMWPPVIAHSIAEQPHNKRRGTYSNRRVHVLENSEIAGKEPTSLDTSVTRPDRWEKICAPLLGPDEQLSQVQVRAPGQPVNCVTPGHQKPICDVMYLAAIVPAFNKLQSLNELDTTPAIPPVHTTDFAHANTCAYNTDPFRKAVQSRSLAMDTRYQYLTPVVHPGVRPMPDTTKLATLPTSTHLVAHTVISTVTSTLTHTITKSTPSTYSFDRLITNAATAVAKNLGVTTFSIEEQLTLIRWVMIALALSGTAGTAYLFGRQKVPQVAPLAVPEGEDPNVWQQKARQMGAVVNKFLGENEKLRTELQEAKWDQKANEQIQQEMAEKTPTLQTDTQRERSHREQEEAKTRAFKLTSPKTPAQNISSTPPPPRTINPRLSRQHSHAQPSTPQPLSPAAQAIRKSYKETIEANTGRLLRKEISSPQLADEIYQKVSGYTPPSATGKRKRSNIEDGVGETSSSPSMNTPQAQITDPAFREKRTEIDSAAEGVAEQPPAKRARLTIPEIFRRPAPSAAISSASPLKRMTRRSASLARIEGASIGSSDELAGPRRSPRKREVVSLNEKELSRRSVAFGEE
jgi:hypothetical protein